VWYIPDGIFSIAKYGSYSTAKIWDIVHHKKMVYTSCKNGIYPHFKKVVYVCTNGNIPSVNCERTSSSKHGTYTPSKNSGRYFIAKSWYILHRQNVVYTSSKKSGIYSMARKWYILHCLKCGIKNGMHDLLLIHAIL
jgi:predicted nucleic-acid-binding Zn-ribbon protein